MLEILRAKRAMRTRIKEEATLKMEESKELRFWQRAINDPEGSLEFNGRGQVRDFLKDSHITPSRLHKVETTKLRDRVALVTIWYWDYS